MAVFTENVFISEFNVHPNKSIGIRKTTEIKKDDVVVSQTYWRCVLEPNASNVQEVLGDEPYYYNLALEAWKE